MKELEQEIKEYLIERNWFSLESGDDFYMKQKIKYREVGE